jgi:hypothetical protein
MASRIKLFALLLLTSLTAHAEGPRFHQKDPSTEQEFVNVYKDIRSTKSAFIQNTNTLQAGSTFYVSSGTVSGTLTVGGFVANNAVISGPVISGTAGTFSTITAGTVTITGGFLSSGSVTGVSPLPSLIGQFISSSAAIANNFGTTTVFNDCVSIPLTPGNWLMLGGMYASRNSSTWSNAELGISTTPGNSPTGLTLGTNYLAGNWANSSTTPDAIPIFVTHVISSNISVTAYLKTTATFTAGTPQRRCGMVAIRLP